MGFFDIFRKKKNEDNEQIHESDNQGQECPYPIKGIMHDRKMGIGFVMNSDDNLIGIWLPNLDSPFLTNPNKLSMYCAFNENIPDDVALLIGQKRYTSYENPIEGESGYVLLFS